MAYIGEKIWIVLGASYKLVGMFEQVERFENQTGCLKALHWEAESAAWHCHLIDSLATTLFADRNLEEFQSPTIASTIKLSKKVVLEIKRSFVM